MRPTVTFKLSGLLGPVFLGIFLCFTFLFFSHLSASSAHGGVDSAESSPQELTLSPNQVCDTVSEIPQSECLALEALYINTNGAGWFSNTDWLVTDTPCSWHGVSCIPGHVTELDLSANNLSGSLPITLTELVSLTHLYLNSNQLTGPIPPELGELSALQYVYLSDNHFTGWIPSQLGQLSSLLELSLALNTEITGPIPPELGDLSSLQLLGLSEMYGITGTIPVSLSLLSNLQSLNLCESYSLEGPIPPELGELSSLDFLWLCSIGLTGPIPPELGSLSNLTNLNLMNNSLTGTIPAALGDLTNLQNLRLDNNILEDEIPTTITNLVNLTVQMDWANGTNFGYNMLTASDPAVITFLNEKDPDWDQTQTVPPTDLQVVREEGHFIDLTWTPINYTWDGGYYQVEFATSPSGPFNWLPELGTKSDDGYRVDNLNPETTYYIRVRTVTPAGENVVNELVSPYSEVVSGATLFAGSGTRYVAPTGSDAGPSLCNNPSSPCLTVDHAYGMANTDEDILVAQGTYIENLNIGHRVNLMGGYESATWTRDINTYETILDGSANTVVWGDWDGDRFGLPVVISDTTGYRLWYDGYNLRDGWAMGMAESSDGILWTKYASNPVMVPGPEGSWDSFYRGQAAAIKEGSVYKLWYSGSDGGRWHTGYAESSDGINWSYHPDNPVLTAGEPGSWDESEADGPTVILDGGLYKMWYHGCDEAYTICALGYATSTNGIDWQKYTNNPVLTPTTDSWEGDQLIWPSVVKVGSTYQMWYNSNGQVGYATSTDGINWVKDPGPQIASDPEGNLLTARSVIVEGGTYKLWYRGAPVGYRYVGLAESPDGVNWTFSSSNPLLLPGTPTTWGQPVVRFAPFASGSTLDGFTVQNGGGEGAGGIDTFIAEVTIHSCLIQNNHANGYMDGFAGSGVAGHGEITIADSQVINNYGAHGIRVGWGNLHMVNSLVAGHPDGAGVSLNGSATLNNVTIGNNQGGILYNGEFPEATLAVTNSIIMFNNYGIGVAPLNQGQVFVNYSDIEQGWPGTGNMNLDPAFVDYENGDFHLAPWSPLIDMGTSTGAPLSDFEGDARPHGSAVDLGFDEFTGTRVETLFTDVASQFGVDTSSGEFGPAWSDLNNDGWLDIMVGNGTVYTNALGTSFADATSVAGLEYPGHRNGVAGGDYDNDGDIDLLYSWRQIYRHDGDLSFTKIFDGGGVQTPLAWVDYDLDGDLDAMADGLLYRNDGSDVFTDLTSAAGLPGDGWLAHVWADYNQDGYPDVYMVCVSCPNRLYQNNGDGTFSHVTSSAGVGDPAAGHGAAWGDYDNDGDLDLFVANNDYTYNVLYQNNGDGTFSDVTSSAGLMTRIGLATSGSWLDYDLDGWLDLFIVERGNRYNGPNRLFHNNSDGTFSEMDGSSGIVDRRDSEGAAVGDYDNDGDPDLYLASGIWGSSTPNHLFRNNTDPVSNGLHWLKVKLVGTNSNRSAIGAVVRLYANGLVQTRQFAGSTGFMSQDALEALFGLGTYADPVTVEITWPSGIVQTLSGIAVDQTIEVVEAADTVELGFNLYTDENGSPGTQILDSSVIAGQSFFVEVYAADLRTTPSGLVGLAVDLSWDPAHMEEIDSPFNPSEPASPIITTDFPLFRGGSLDNLSGSVDELRGGSLPSAGLGQAIGNGAPERFALLHFTPEIAVSDSVLNLALGSNGISLADGSTSFDLVTQPVTLTILERPAITILDSSEVAGDASLQFLTDLSSYRPGTPDSTLVRSSYADQTQYIDLTNSGGSDLLLSQIEINAPDVTISPSLTSDPGDDLTLQPGNSQRFTITYAPSIPSLGDPTGQDFDLVDGLVIHSNVSGQPTLNVALRGRSTFNSDISYDGAVNLGELGVLNNNFGRCAGLPNWDPTADINGDECVNLGDLGVLNAEYGLTLPPAASIQDTLRLQLLSPNEPGVMTIEVNFYTDNAGTPGDLIPDGTLELGQDFFVELLVGDIRTGAAGVIALSTDLAWNPDFIAESDSPFDPTDPASLLVTGHYPLFRGGSLDNIAGFIDELHGGSLPSAGLGQAVGVNNLERFSLMKFTAEELTNGRTPLTVTLGSLGASLADGESFSLDVESQTYQVVQPGDRVQADFGGSPVSGPAPLFVEFTNLSSGDYDTCEWDFGDLGTSSLCVGVTHTYTIPGTYTVTLSTSGPGGEDILIKPAYVTVTSAGNPVYIPLLMSNVSSESIGAWVPAQRRQTKR